MEDELPADTRVVVLVEGVSDRSAVETLARRRGVDLDASGIVVVSMSGVTNIGRFLERFGPAGWNRHLAGLYDVAEEPHVVARLERAGLGTCLGRRDVEALGFYACDADLEDELIRALGVEAVENFVERLGELDSFRTFQRQPAQRGRSPERQLRRFIGTKSGRKERYAPGLVGELDDRAVPRPLDRVLDTARRLADG